jgi:hypothetical protein
VKTVVFAGPTLAPDVVLDALGPLGQVNCLPPAGQGDVYRAAILRPDAIGIVDGYFDHQPAVWHKEILWAMSQGVHVFGSASMGALRAAELAPFGMVGVGAIYQAFRDGILEDDDEVAVAHGDQASGYRVMSEAMVNIRATVAAAETAGVIQPHEARELLRTAKALYYPERCYPAILERVQAPPALRGWLAAHTVDQKRLDAVAMLDAMRDSLSAAPGPKVVDYAFEESTQWEGLRRDIHRGVLSAADRLVLGRLAANPELLAHATSGAVLWRLAGKHAPAALHTLPAHLLLDQSVEFCRRHGLSDWDAVEKWLLRNHFDRAGLERLLSLRAQASVLEADAAAERDYYLLQYLRWTGDYEKVISLSDDNLHGPADR